MRKIVITIILTLLTAKASAFFGCFDEGYRTSPCYTGYERWCEPKKVEPRCGWFLFAEFLYWRVHEGGLFYGPGMFEQVTDDCGCVTTEVVEDASKHPKNFSWNPGFRIGLGQLHTWNCWDFEAYWTHINGHASGKMDSDNHTRWNLQFNVVDAFFIRDFKAQHLLFSPIFGLRGAFISQKQKSHEVDIMNVPNDTFTINVCQDNKQHFNGVGPLIGLWTEIDFCHCFKAYAEVSGAAIFGKFTVNCKEKGSFLDVQNCSNCRKHPRNCQFVVDAAAGFGWEPCFCRDRIDLLLSIGYEYHQYFDHNYLGCSGDLTLQGLTCSAKISY